MPGALVADLDPIAEHHGLTMEQTIQALVELVSGIYARTHPEGVCAAPDSAPALDELSTPL